MTPPLPRWISLWLYGVAALHTLFGVAAFAPQWRIIAQRGLWDTVQEDAHLADAVLFVQVGILVYALAAYCASPGAIWPPRAVDMWLLNPIIQTVIVLPASGYWLLLPPAIAIARRRKPEQAQISG